jgi:hypothetical protein
MEDRAMTEKGDIEKPSLVMRIFGPLVFIFGTIGALWWFFYSVFNFYKSLSAEAIEFEKGDFYFLGGGIALFILATVTAQVFWFNNPLSKSQNKYFARAALTSIVLMLVLPQVVHYFVNDYMTKHGYSICQVASQQWVLNRTIMYIKPTIECKKDLIYLFGYNPNHVTLEDFRKK